MDDVQESIDTACNTLKNNTNEGFKEMTTNLLANFVRINKQTDIKSKTIEIDESKLKIVFSTYSK